MGMGGGSMRSIFDVLRGREDRGLTAEEVAALRASGITPLGQSPLRTQDVYTQPTQTSDYANPIPQYTPSSFNMTPYAQAYQQQFNAMQPMQPPQLPQAPQQVSGLGALAQLYGMHNAAPQDSASQDTHAASIAAAANTPI
jgi:hypothetical protein